MRHQAQGCRIGSQHVLPSPWQLMAQHSACPPPAMVPASRAVQRKASSCCWGRHVPPREPGMNLFTFRGSASKFKIMRDVKIGKSEGGGDVQARDTMCPALSLRLHLKLGGGLQHWSKAGTATPSFSRGFWRCRLRSSCLCGKHALTEPSPRPTLEDFNYMVLVAVLARCPCKSHS